MRFTTILGSLLLVVLLSFSAATSAAEGEYKLRVIFWDVSTIPATILDEAREISKYESHNSYGFLNGAISRGLGPKLIASWQRGVARTVRVRVSGSFEHPGARGEFSAYPGDYHDYPNATILQHTVSKQLLLDHGDPQFVVEYELPEICRLPDFLQGKDFYRRLSTRTSRYGENELKESIRRGSRAMNLHFLLLCP